MERNTKNELTDSFNPKDPSHERKSVDLLPTYLRTDKNAKILSSTFDRLIETPKLERINGYVGTKITPTYNPETDLYLSSTSELSQDYQLEPSLIVRDDTNNIKTAVSYDDFLNQLKFYNGSTDNHDKILRPSTYAYHPHIDWDKFVNFNQYYWLEAGPDPIEITGKQRNTVSTYAVTDATEGGETATSIVDLTTAQVAAINQAGTVFMFSPDSLTPNPVLTLYRGMTYVFNVTSSHSFYVKTAVSYGKDDQYSKVINNGVKIGQVIVTVDDYTPSTLWYVAGDDTRVFGKFVVKKLVENSELDVEKEIIGKKTFRSGNNVTFTNGMLVYFPDSVFPESYKNKRFIVEGVGTKIVLVNFDSLTNNVSAANNLNTNFDAQDFDEYPFDDFRNAPITPDYVTINRASINLNPWTRYNRWFHIDVITASATANGVIPVYPQGKRGQRPIIEFSANIKLHNFGYTAKTNVHLIDNITLDAFDKVEKSAGYYVDGVLLEEGYRVIFNADEDPLVRGRIYNVSIETINGNQKINLVEDLNGIPEIGNSIVTAEGVEHRGASWWWDGHVWKYAQQRTSFNQAPYFDLFDENGISYSNTTYYQGSFIGTRVFGYLVGQGAPDPILGFPLTYSSAQAGVGDYLFKNYFNTDTFIVANVNNGITVDVSSGYLQTFDGSTTAYENVWADSVDTLIPILQYNVITEVTDAIEINSIDNAGWAFDSLTVEIYINDVKQIANGYNYNLIPQDNYLFAVFTSNLKLHDRVLIKLFTYQLPNTLGYYEPSLGLTNNPLNGPISELTLAEVSDHLRTIAHTHPDFVGSVIGPNNLRDLGVIGVYGTRLISHIEPMSFAHFFLGIQQHNIIPAIRKVAADYQNFKSGFISKVNEISNALSPSDAVDIILSTFNAGKDSQFPYGYTDMLAYGNDYTSRKYTVTDLRITTYSIISAVDTADLNERAVLIYLNNKQLIANRDYRFNGLEPNVTFIVKLSIGDTIEIKDFQSTAGSYIPPTPTKLGLYPKFQPLIYTDTSYVTPTLVLQGHDGSVMIAYGDYRDDIILELESRIYNNIKSASVYNQSLLDINTILPGAFRNKEFSYNEIFNIISPDFLKWAGTNGVDYQTNVVSTSEPKTWNFRESAIEPNTGLRLPGHWRGIFKYFYDTDRPHTHPWEMLGFSEQPDWWESQYGPAPYTSGNTLLWDDLSLGRIRQGARQGYDSLYVRPKLLNIIPVGEHGEILDPTTIGLAQSVDITKVDAFWKFGDHSPSETAFRRSSLWPFAVQVLLSLTKPSKYCSTMIDPSRITISPAGQYVYGTNRQLLKLKDIVLYREELNGVRQLGSGYSVMLIEANLQRSFDYISELRKDITNADYNLMYKAEGFLSKDKLNVVIDSVDPQSINPGVLLPAEDYSITLIKSNPILSLSISGIIIQKVDGSFRIKGYDNYKPYFTILNPIHSLKDVEVRVGGYSESYVTWESGKFYQTGQLVQNNSSYYRTKASHTSSGTFDLTKFQQIPNLPITGGISAARAVDFETTATVIPYGTVLYDTQAVYDFIIGYGMYLESQGFVFDYLQPDFGEVLNWEFTGKEFLFWTTQNWATGSLITLSPFAYQLKFSTTAGVGATIYGIVDDVTDPFYEYTLQTADGTALPVTAFNLSREDNEFIIVTHAPTIGIYFAQLNIIQKQHGLVFANRSMFNDIVYDIETGYRQNRVKLAGFRTSAWNGGLTSPGFVFDEAIISNWQKFTDYNPGEVVRASGKYYSAISKLAGTDTFNIDDWNVVTNKPEPSLLPNFEYKIQQFEDFYSLDIDNFDAGQQKMAQHLTGYTPRRYLDNIFNDSIAQYKFYQGYIKEKGTANAIKKLAKASLNNLKGQVEFKESWAFRIGHFGGYNSYQELQINLEADKFAQNPQVIEFTDYAKSSNNFIYYKPVDDVLIKPEDYDFNKAFPTFDAHYASYTPEIPVAGYVRIDDVDATVYNTNSLLDIGNTDLIKEGTTFWLGFRSDGEWDVLRYTRQSQRIIQAVIETPGESIRFTTSANHNLQVGEILAITRFIPTLNKVYVVIGVPSANEFLVSSSLSSIPYSEKTIKTITASASSVTFNTTTNILIDTMSISPGANVQGEFKLGMLLVGPGIPQYPAVYITGFTDNGIAVTGGTAKALGAVTIVENNLPVHKPSDQTSVTGTIDDIAGLLIGTVFKFVSVRFKNFDELRSLPRLTTTNYGDKIWVDDDNPADPTKGKFAVYEKINNYDATNVGNGVDNFGQLYGLRSSFDSSTSTYTISAPGYNDINYGLGKVFVYDKISTRSVIANSVVSYSLNEEGGSYFQSPRSPEFGFSLIYDRNQEIIYAGAPGASRVRGDTSGVIRNVKFSNLAIQNDDIGMVKISAIDRDLANDVTLATITSPTPTDFGRFGHALLATKDPIPVNVSQPTFDGTGHHPTAPLRNSAGSSIGRYGPARFADGVYTIPTGLPNARFISNVVVAGHGTDPDPSGVSGMMYAWGQFLTHDLSFERQGNTDTIDIEVPQDDQALTPGSTIPVTRVAVTPFTGPGSTIPAAPINDVTGWIDASVVYGVAYPPGVVQGTTPFANPVTLREGGETATTGKLETSPGGLYPAVEDGMFKLGDPRGSENPDLTAIQTLWVREHNYHVDRLTQLHPEWTGEQLYQRARQIVIAEVQNITYQEWLPKVIGVSALPAYTGFKPNVDATIKIEFAAAALRFGHSIVSNQLDRINEQGVVTEALTLANAFFLTPAQFERNGGADGFMRKLAADVSNKLDVHIVDDLRNLLNDPPAALDLAAINIQRGRDLGLPTLNQMRTTLGLSPYTAFGQITTDTATATALQTAYGNVNAVDLWIGGLAEDRVSGALVGPTFRTILIDQFLRIRDGDALYFENQRWAESDLIWLKNTTLSDVILRNTNTVRLQADSFVAVERTDLYNGAVPTITPRHGGVDFPQPRANKQFLVSAPGEGVGKVYRYNLQLGVYNTSTANITVPRQAILPSSGLSVGSQFGRSMAGDRGLLRIAIGAPNYLTDTGAVLIYKLDRNDYTLIQTIDKNTNGIDGIINTSDKLGFTLAMSQDGEYLFVSSPGTQTGYYQGMVSVWQWSTDHYKWLQNITNPNKNANTAFGVDISINDNKETLVISSLGDLELQSMTFDVYMDLLDNANVIYGSKYVKDPASDKRKIKTTFDGNATRFYSKISNAGTVSVFNRYNTYFSYAQELFSTKITDGSNFGYSLGQANDVIYVGAPSSNTHSGQNNGETLIFQKIDTTLNSWAKIRSEDELVDVSAMQRVLTIDSNKDSVKEYIEVIDPMKGKIPGAADQELNYKTIFDPAVYSIGGSDIFVDTNTNWIDEHVGELWWDLSSVKYYWYEQGELDYRKNHWGTIFPGSTISIYEWVRTELLPTEWSALADTAEGLSKGVSGQPKYVNNSAVSVKQIYNSVTNTFKNVYYFWVRNKTTLPEGIKFRRTSALSVASLIADPKNQNLKAAYFIAPHAVALVNIKDLIKNDYLNLHINYDSIKDSAQRHTEWLLLQENDEFSVPTVMLEKKLFDSLSGFDAIGQAVPDPALSAQQRYGISIRPRQSMFVDRQKALKNLLTWVNDILLENRITSIIDFNNLIASEAIPDIDLNQYDVIVEDMNELSKVITKGFAQAAMSCILTSNGGIGKIMINATGNGYSPQHPPTIEILGDGEGAVIQAVCNDQGQVISAIVVEPGRGYTHIPRLVVRPYSVIVRVDNTANNLWSKFEWSSLDKDWLRVHTQEYDVSRYWYAVDWKDASYNNLQDLGTTINDVYELDSVTVDVGDYVKIKNGGAGRYIVLRKNPLDSTGGSFNTSWDIVFEEGGTIQIDPKVYDKDLTLYAFDEISAFDQTLYDQSPDIELVYILKAIKEDLFVGSYKPYWNKFFFKAVKYALSEQPSLDWTFKTTFIDVINHAGSLDQRPTYKLQNSSYYEEWINEVKPYHTQIRRFITAYTGTDITNTFTSDFDLPAFYNSSTGKFETPSATNAILNYYPYRNWTENYTMGVSEIVVTSYGFNYVNPPVVKIITAPNDTGYGATARAYISLGGVVEVEITNSGTGYTITPTVLFEGGLGIDGVVAAGRARLSNGKVRSNSVTMKFDRISYIKDTSNTEDINVVDTFITDGENFKYKLTWLPRPDRNTIKLLSNGSMVLNDKFNITYATELFTNTNGMDYYVQVATLELAYVPVSDIVLEMSYIKDTSTLNAIDRVNHYYAPTPGMPGKDPDQLMKGLSYGGVLVDTLPFNYSSGWDQYGKQGWWSNAWDSYASQENYGTVSNPQLSFATLLQTSQNDLAVVNDEIATVTIYIAQLNAEKDDTPAVVIDPNGTNYSYISNDAYQYLLGLIGQASVNLADLQLAKTKLENIISNLQHDLLPVTTPFIVSTGTYINVYINTGTNALTTRIDKSVSTTTQTIVGQGTTATVYVPLGLFGNSTDSIIIFRDQQSDGTILPADPNALDIVVQGGELDNITLGIAPSDILLDGSGFITAESSHAPEEMLPGQVQESFGITVFEQRAQVSPLIINKKYLLDGFSTSFDIGGKIASTASVLVSVGTTPLRYGVDYTVNTIANLVQLTQVTTSGWLNISGMTVGGTGLVDSQLVTNRLSTSTVITSSVALANIKDVYVTINGQETTNFIIGPAPGYAKKKKPKGAVTVYHNAIGSKEIQLWIFNSPAKAFSQIHEQVFTNINVANDSFILAQPPFSALPHHTQIIVEFNKKRLLPPQVTYYATEAGQTEFVVDLNDPTLPGQIDVSTVEIYLNGRKLIPGTEFNFQPRPVRAVFPVGVLNPNGGDVLAIVALVGHQYRVDDDGILYIQDVPRTNNNDTLRVITFSNDSGKFINASSGNVSREGMLRKERFAANKVGRYVVSKPIGNTNYAWVEYAGNTLINDIDFSVSIDGLTVTLREDIYQSSDDKVVITTFDYDNYQGPTAYRMFTDILGRTSFKTLSKANTTELAQPLVASDSKIYVKDVSVLSIPAPEQNRPGIVYIAGERIEYFSVAIETNVLSNLRRGTLGTGILDGLPTGTAVIDQGLGQNIPVQETTTIERFSTSTAVTKFTLTNIVLSTACNFHDQIEVNVGGIPLLKPTTNPVVTTDLTIAGNSGQENSLGIVNTSTLKANFTMSSVIINNITRPVIHFNLPGTLSEDGSVPPGVEIRVVKRTGHIFENTTAINFIKDRPSFLPTDAYYPGDPVIILETGEILEDENNVPLEGI